LSEKWPKGVLRHAKQPGWGLPEGVFIQNRLPAKQFLPCIRQLSSKPHGFPRSICSGFRQKTGLYNYLKNAAPCRDAIPPLETCILQFETL